MPGRNSLRVRHPFDLCELQSADGFSRLPAGRCRARGRAPSDVTEDLGHQRWMLDAGDDAEFPPTLRTGLDVDKVNGCAASGEGALGHGENALQSLHPGHRRGGLIAVCFAAGAVRHDTFAVSEIGCEHPVKAGEVQLGARHECGESRDKI